MQLQPLGTEHASSPRWLRLLGPTAFAAVVLAQGIALVTSPPDRDMGHRQKIMYVHVPVAWMAFISFFVVLVASVSYLWREREEDDALAAAAAEVGAMFTALTLVLGSLWGRPTWGVWWTWDARLTSTAVLLVIFVSYLALRAFTDDPERRARWSAAVGILGALNVPVVYMSVKWWRSLHQMQSTPSTLDPAYMHGLRLNAIAFLLLTRYFIGRRVHASTLERQVAARDEALALGRPTTDTPEVAHV